MFCVSSAIFQEIITVPCKVSARDYKGAQAEYETARAHAQGLGRHGLLPADEEPDPEPEEERLTATEKEK